MPNTLPSQYAQGAVSSTLGYASGETTKSEAVQEMKDAKAASDSQPPAKSGILGTAEKTAGNLAGCEGMQDEGQQRMPQKAGIEEQSGTG